jgi:hypothetical protein
MNVLDEPLALQIIRVTSKATAPRTRSSAAHFVANLHDSGRMFLLLLLVAVGTGTAVAPAAAQSRLTERLCRGCDLRIEHEVRLGSSEGSGAIAATDVIVRHPHTGYYYVSHDADPGTLAVFDPQGRIARYVGRSGRGPGEFLSVIDLVATTSEVYAVDRRNGRIVALSVADSVLRMVPLVAPPRPAGTAALPRSGYFVLAAHITSRDLFGYAIHTFDGSGHRLASFDTASGTSLLPTDTERLNRRLTNDGEDVWAAHVHQYVLQKWTSGGRLLRSYVRDVDWFKSWQQRPRLTPQGGRISEVMDVRFEAEERLLWVLVQVPDASRDWARGLIRDQGRDGRWYYGAGDLNRIYDTVIEVIDPDSGLVLASVQVDAALRRFLYGRRVAGHAADPDGTEYVDVWRLVGFPTRREK